MCVLGSTVKQPHAGDSHADDAAIRPASKTEYNLELLAQSEKIYSAPNEESKTFNFGNF